MREYLRLSEPHGFHDVGLLAVLDIRLVEQGESEYECGALTARFPIELDESRHNPIERRIGCA